MGLIIESQFEYLKSRLNIPESRLQQYQNSTVEEILLSEAAQGNLEAIKLAADMFTDPQQLVELFQLADPSNKIIIMNKMDNDALKELISSLETDDLVAGLQFFSQEKLLDLLKDIPIEELVKTVFQMFEKEELINLIPEEDLNKFLTAFDMDKDLVLKELTSIPAMYLQQILESVTGEEQNGTSEELVATIEKLSPQDYKNAIENLHYVQKQELTLAITKSHPDLFEKFEADTYTKIIKNERNKSDLIKSMGVIKPEYLQNMIKELPRDLMTIVISQIDSEKFADILISNHPEILAKFIAG